MPAVKMHWADPAKKQFDALRQRAADTGHLAEFIAVHNEIIEILSDLERATAKGDPLYNTKKPGGVVRHFLQGFISVTYYIFADELVGWITKYVPIPVTWPDGEST
jgi:hypothetical protein